MVLHVDYDAAYLVFPNVQSFIAGVFLLGHWPPPHPYKPKPKQNGPILTEVKSINNVVFSAA